MNWLFLDGLQYKLFWSLSWSWFVINPGDCGKCGSADMNTVLVKEDETQLNYIVERAEDWIRDSRTSTRTSDLNITSSWESGPLTTTAVSVAVRLEQATGGGGGAQPVEMEVSLQLKADGVKGCLFLWIFDLILKLWLHTQTDTHRSQVVSVYHFLPSWAFIQKRHFSAWYWHLC